VPYLIDGHNLIPNIPGLRLDNPNDESQLIRLLQAFCQVRKQKAEVFFDRAAPGSAGKQVYGLVSAHFIARSSNADQAIRARLAHLGKAAHNWSVVSSDREVQSAARSAGAKVMSAAEFASLLLGSQRRGSASEEKPQPDPAQNEELLRLFRRGKKTPPL
jgi:predicted RNA-binding protein with PIN domain